MSDNRKVLVAKRQNGNNRNQNTANNSANIPENNEFKRGIKRTLPPATPKNLANDRMKRLRTELNEQARTSPSAPSTPRAPNTPNAPSAQSAVNSILEKEKKRRNRPKRRQQTQGDVSSPKVPKKEINTSLSSQKFVPADSKIIGNEQSNRNIFTITEPVYSPKPASTAVVSNQIETIFKSSSNYEEMEWSPAEDDDLSTEPNTSKGSEVIESVKSGRNDFYIVVDTNIFISELHLIKQILEFKATEHMEPIIFIPWIVIEELDFIKDDSSKTKLKWKAQEAVKYIETKLSAKNHRMIGQTLNEVNEQQQVGKGQDNKILACCLQVLKKYKNMILLTNDINLKNKAHINKIPVCAQSEIMKKILLMGSKGTKAQIILDKMTSLCNVVIEDCAQKAYGKVCHKMPICQAKPQSLSDCIAVFNKYWFPVFQEFLMKQFKKAVEDFSNFLLANKNIKDGSSEMDELLRHSVRICVFLKDVDACRNEIENTIRELNDIKLV